MATYAFGALRSRHRITPVGRQCRSRGIRRAITGAHDDRCEPDSGRPSIGQEDGRFAGVLRSAISETRRALRGETDQVRIGYLPLLVMWRRGTAGGALKALLDALFTKVTPKAKEAKSQLPKPSLRAANPIPSPPSF